MIVGVREGSTCSLSFLALADSWNEFLYFWAGLYACHKRVHDLNRSSIQQKRLFPHRGVPSVSQINLITWIWAFTLHRCRPQSLWDYSIWGDKPHKRLSVGEVYTSSDPDLCGTGCRWHGVLRQDTRMGWDCCGKCTEVWKVSRGAEPLGAPSSRGRLRPGFPGPVPRDWSWEVRANAWEICMLTTTHTLWHIFWEISPLRGEGFQ